MEKIINALIVLLAIFIAACSSSYSEGNKSSISIWTLPNGSIAYIAQNDVSVGSNTPAQVTTLV